jgi:hypothetical protein
MTHNEDVIEVELSSQDLLTLTRQSNSPDKRRSSPRFSSRLAYGVAAAGVVAVAGALIALRATHVDAPMPAVAMAGTPSPVVAALSPTPEAVAAPPVKFANPFDRKEVFEFPAGTSRAEARQRVAELLIKRAQERRPALRRVASKRTGVHPA